MRKDELNEFGNSLDFLSSKYDESAKSANEMRESLDFQWNGEQGIMWTGFNDRIHGCSLWQWDGKHETDSNFQQEFAACKIA